MFRSPGGYGYDSTREGIPIPGANSSTITLDLGQLRTETKRRGLDGLGLFARDPWETLDREEIFTPVAYARHGVWHYDQPGCLADGDLNGRSGHSG